MGWLFAALAALLFAGGNARGGSGSRPKITEGTVTLKANRPYRIELEVSGLILQKTGDPNHLVKVAQGLDNGLRMAGAYDVLVQPSVPIRVSYSVVTPGDLPIVLNVPVNQPIDNTPADYTFRSVQELPASRLPA